MAVRVEWEKYLYPLVATYLTRHLTLEPAANNSKVLTNKIIGIVDIIAQSGVSTYSLLPQHLAKRLKEYPGIGIEIAGPSCRCSLTFYPERQRCDFGSYGFNPNSLEGGRSRHCVI
jgi:hypothetical protein